MSRAIQQLEAQRRQRAQRVSRVWHTANAVFFGSLLIWFCAFAAGLLGRVSPWF